MNYLSISDRARLKEVISELKVAKKKQTKAARWVHCYKVLNEIVIRSTLSVALDIRIWKLSHAILDGGKKRLLPQ